MPPKPHHVPEPVHKQGRPRAVRSLSDSGRRALNRGEVGKFKRDLAELAAYPENFGEAELALQGEGEQAKHLRQGVALPRSMYEKGKVKAYSVRPQLPDGKPLKIRESVELANVPRSHSTEDHKFRDYSNFDIFRRQGYTPGQGRFFHNHVLVVDGVNNLVSLHRPVLLSGSRQQLRQPAFETPRRGPSQLRATHHLSHKYTIDPETKRMKLDRFEEEKFHQGRLQYKKNLIIILTNAKVKPQYTTIAKPTPVLVRTDIPKLLRTLNKI
jgi:hypothetical protein